MHRHVHLHAPESTRTLSEAPMDAPSRYTHTRPHARARACTHMQAHAHKPPRALMRNTRTHTRTHTRIHTDIHTHPHAPTHTCTNPAIPTRTHTHRAHRRSLSCQASTTSSSSWTRGSRPATATRSWRRAWTPPTAARCTPCSSRPSPTPAPFLPTASRSSPSSSSSASTWVRSQPSRSTRRTAFVRETRRSSCEESCRSSIGLTQSCGTSHSSKQLQFEAQRILKHRPSTPISNNLFEQISPDPDFCFVKWVAWLRTLLCDSKRALSVLVRAFGHCQLPALRDLLSCLRVPLPPVHHFELLCTFAEAGVV
eukprot:6196865-Pleurochrysis_carterae.AAC.4